MTKRIFLVLVTILLIILLLFVLLIRNYVVRFSDQEQAEQITYHLQVFVSDNQEYSVTEFEKGALQAADLYGVYVEFIEYVDYSTNFVQLADQAIYSDVDGVAIKITDFDAAQEAISNLVKSDISVVVYESGHFTELLRADELDICTTGSNSHNLGVLAGNLALAASDTNITAAIITNIDIDEDESLYRDNIILGLQEVFSQHNEISFKLETVYNQRNTSLPAEQIVDSILSDSPDINTIICFDERNTPAITQALVDKNKLEDINVIGYGVLPQTLNYILRGVIFGTICPDSNAIGYDTVESLAQMLDGKTVSDTKYEKANIVTKDNVDDYIQQQG